MTEKAKLACIGGGVAALYLAIAIKNKNPDMDIDIYEKSDKVLNTGWGIILKNNQLKNMEVVDRKSYHEILKKSASWRELEVRRGNEKIVIPAQNGQSIGRYEFIDILRNRAQELGANLRYQSSMSLDSLTDDHTLVIGADGINSNCRSAITNEESIIVTKSSNKFIWLACDKAFDRMIFDFIQLPQGNIWAHIYPFRDGMSTFVVEVDQQLYSHFQFGKSDIHADVKIIKSIFSKTLKDTDLLWLNNAPNQWLTFKQISCTQEHLHNVILIGDAAHTAHFSIGSGTSMAIGDAICLANSITDNISSIDQIKTSYTRDRKKEVFEIQNQALNSMFWFDQMHKHIKLPISEFVRSFMFRSVNAN